MLKSIIILISNVIINIIIIRGINIDGNPSSTTKENSSDYNSVILIRLFCKINASAKKISVVLRIQMDRQSWSLHWKLARLQQHFFPTKLTMTKTRPDTRPQMHPALLSRFIGRAFVRARVWVGMFVHVCLSMLV